MTDAQHTAHQAKKGEKTIRARVAGIIRRNPGITHIEADALYRQEYGPAGDTTVQARLSELAADGVVYVNGKKKVDGSRMPLSRYYFEPDPECRFTIRVQSKNEAFLRWLRAADRYADRLPSYVFRGLMDRATLLADTMEMVEQNPAPAGEKAGQE